MLFPFVHSLDTIPNTGQNFLPDAYPPREGSPGRANLSHRRTRGAPSRRRGWGWRRLVTNALGNTRDTRSRHTVPTHSPDDTGGPTLSPRAFQRSVRLLESGGRLSASRRAHGESREPRPPFHSAPFHLPVFHRGRATAGSGLDEGKGGWAGGCVRVERTRPSTHRRERHWLIRLIRSSCLGR
jgi:hypothetical protein